MGFIFLLFPISIIIAIILSFFATKRIMRNASIQGFARNFWSVIIFIFLAVLAAFCMIVALGNSFEFGR